MSNIVDLDAYRAKRTADGTWPPNDLEVREYWRSRRNMGDRPAPAKELSMWSEKAMEFINKLREKDDRNESQWGPKDPGGAA
jgi:hypothetical protein